MNAERTVVNGENRMSRTNSQDTPRTIEAGVVYGLDEFKKRSRFGNHAMRTACRNGLKVRYVGGRGFVLGDDFLAYLAGLR